MASTGPVTQSSQEAYDVAYEGLFNTLDWMDEIA